MRDELAGQLEVVDVVEDCLDEEDDVDASDESEEESQVDDSREEEAEVDGVELAEALSKSEESGLSLGPFTIDKSVGVTFVGVVAKCGPSGVYLT